MRNSANDARSGGTTSTASRSLPATRLAFTRHPCGGPRDAIGAPPSSSHLLQECPPGNRPLKLSGIGHHLHATRELRYKGLQVVRQKPVVAHGNVEAQGSRYMVDIERRASGRGLLPVQTDLQLADEAVVAAGRYRHVGDGSGSDESVENLCNFAKIA